MAGLFANRRAQQAHDNGSEAQELASLAGLPATDGGSATAHPTRGASASTRGVRGAVVRMRNNRVRRRAQSRAADSTYPLTSPVAYYMRTDAAGATQGIKKPGAPSECTTAAAETSGGGAPASGAPAGDSRPALTAAWAYIARLPNTFSVVALVDDAEMVSPTTAQPSTLAATLALFDSRFSPTELGWSDSRPVMFAGQYFWTRAHAFYYGKIVLLGRLLPEVAQPALSRQLLVGNDETLRSIASAKQAVDAYFTQTVTCHFNCESQTTEAVEAVVAWPAFAFSHCVNVLMAASEQYPDIKQQCQRLWQQGCLLVANDDRLSLAWLECIFRWQGLVVPASWGQQLLQRAHALLVPTDEALGAGEWLAQYMTTDSPQAALQEQFGQPAVTISRYKKFTPADYEHTALALLLNDIPFASRQPRFLWGEVMMGGKKPSPCIWIHFTNPAVAFTFSRRLQRSYGFSAQRVTCIDASAPMTQLRLKHMDDYTHVVSIQLDYPGQLCSLLYISSHNPALFPYYGEACMQLLKKLFADVPIVVKSARATTTTTTTTLNVCADARSQMIDKLCRVDVTGEMKAALQLIVKPHYDLFKEAVKTLQYPPVVYNADSIDVRLLLKLLAQYPASGNANESQSALLSHHLLAQAGVCAEAVADTLCKYKVQLFDEHTQSPSVYLQRDALKTAAQSLQVLTWRNSHKAATQGAVTPADGESPQPAQQPCNGHMTVSRINHYIDTTDGVMHHASIWQFSPSVKVACPVGQSAVSTRSKRTRSVRKTKATQCTDVHQAALRQRYEVVFSEASACGVRFLAMSVEAMAGELNQAGREHALQVHVEALCYAAQENQGLELLVIAAPVNEDNGQLYLALKQHLAFMKSCLRRMAVVVVDSPLPALTNGLLRYMREVNIGFTKPLKLPLAIVVPSHTEQAKQYDSDAFLVQSPKYNSAFANKVHFKTITCTTEASVAATVNEAGAGGAVAAMATTTTTTAPTSLRSLR